MKALEAMLEHRTVLFLENVTTNLDHFRMITPCGLHGTGMVEHAEREAVGHDGAAKRMPIGKDGRRIEQRTLAEPTHE